MVNNDMDRIVCVDFQATADCFRENLVPYKNLDGDELLDWFDHWIDWVVGAKCIEGNDVEYVYSYSEQAIARLDALGIEYEVR